MVKGQVTHKVQLQHMTSQDSQDLYNDSKIILQA